MSQFLASGSQIIGASASASVLPMNIQEWFPLGFPLCCPRDSQESFPTSQPQNINSYVLRFLYGTILISMHDYWKKAIILTRQTIVVKAIVLLFNMLSSFVIVFSSKEQASFNFMAAVNMCSDFRTPQNKICHCFHCFPIYLSWSDGASCHDLCFLNVVF